MAESGRVSEGRNGASRPRRSRFRAWEGYFLGSNRVVVPLVMLVAVSGLAATPVGDDQVNETAMVSG